MLRCVTAGWAIRPRASYTSDSVISVAIAVPLLSGPELPALLLEPEPVMTRSLAEHPGAAAGAALVLTAHARPVGLPGTALRAHAASARAHLVQAFDGHRFLPG
jgi:hypothetical protein